MTREDFTLIASTLTALLATFFVALSAVPAGAAALSKEYATTSRDYTNPEVSYGTFQTLDAPRPAWTVECDGEVQSQISSIELNHTWQIDLIRCLRLTRSDLSMIPAESEDDFDQVDLLVLPWLEAVGGDVIVAPRGAETFDTIRLPRLERVDGKLSLDFRGMFEGLRLPSLSTVSAVDVWLRINDIDVTGLDALQSIEGRLYLNNATPANQIGATGTFRGLDGLTEVGSLRQIGFGARDDILKGPALSKLTLVHDDVTIEVEDVDGAPSDYQPIYSTRAIETICGNLTVTDPGGLADPLVAFAALQHVAGSATWNGSPLLTLLPGVTYGGSTAACP